MRYAGAITEGSRADLMLRTLITNGEISQKAMTLVVEPEDKRYAYKVAERLIDHGVMQRFMSRGERLSTYIYQNTQANTKYIEGLYGEAGLQMLQMAALATKEFRYITNSDINEEDRRRYVMRRRRRCLASEVTMMMARAKVPVFVNDKTAISARIRDQRHTDDTKITDYIRYDSIYETKDEADEKNIAASRIHGTYVGANGIYAVYNTGQNPIVWNTRTEQRAAEYVNKLKYVNPYRRDESIWMRGILFYNSIDTIKEILRDYDAQRDGKTMAIMNVGEIYGNVVALPLSVQGIQQLRIMKIEKWKQRFCQKIGAKYISASTLNTEVEYDAQYEGKYAKLYIDCDVMSLIRFVQNNSVPAEKKHIICYEWQMPILQHLATLMARIHNMDISCCQEDEVYEMVTEPV